MVLRLLLMALRLLLLALRLVPPPRAPPLAPVTTMRPSASLLRCAAVVEIRVGKPE